MKGRTLPQVTVAALAVLACAAAPAAAGVNANGGMLVHTDDSINYTTGVNYCAQQLPGTCEALGTRTDKHDPNAAVIFAVAVFMPTASPCVTTVQFGIHHNLPPNQGYIYAYSMCGTLELPDTGWPEQGDPGVGDLVATNPTTALIWPFYWFACDENGAGTFFGTRTYPSTNEAKFVDCSQPPIEDLCTRFGTVRWFGAGQNDCPMPPTGACCLPDGSCQVMTQEQCVGMGFAYQGDGTSCTPNPCIAVGACCFIDGTCQVLPALQCQQQPCATYLGDGTTCSPNPCPGIPYGACCLPGDHCILCYAQRCQQEGHTYMGDGIPCNPDPCAPPTGACCFPDCHCVVETQTQCAADGGVYYGDHTTCSPNPCDCPPTGACCFPDGSCQVLMEAQCSGQGGQYQGDGTSCSPNPCPPVPTKHATWGEIKARYR